DLDALRLRRLARLLTVRDSVRVAGEHVADLALVEADGLRDAQRKEERAGLLSVRIVGRVDDLLRRHEAQEAEQVDRAPDGRVEEAPPLSGEGVRGVREVGVAGGGEDRLRPGVVVSELFESRRDRRQAAAGMDEDRDAAVGRECEDGDEALVVWE